MSSQRSKRRRVQQRTEELMQEVKCEETASQLNTGACNQLCTFEPSRLVNEFSFTHDNFDLSPRNSNGKTEKEFDDSCEDCDKIEPVDSSLINWSLRHNITNAALDDLLTILQPNISTVKLPKCARTLLKTPKVYDISEVCGGQYHYFGLKNTITRFEASDFSPSFQFKLLNISISVDGVPISKSSNRQFWPLLCSFDDTLNKKPFLLALYFGLSKPNNISDFLRPFVDEFIEINRTGIFIAGNTLSLKIKCVVADAPARSFLKYTVPYNAYHGCERCCDKGVFKGRVIYTKLNADKRSDNSFKEQSDPSHHNGISPLIELGVGLVSDVVLDYMHLVCLGVTRKLLLCWYKGPLPYKLSQNSLSIISRRLIFLKKFFPVEFNRKPRTLYELNNWKATELRSFLLYSGPLVLHSVLDEKKYKHFLLLSVAIRILLSENREWYSFAKELLVKFVVEIAVLYSKEFLVYNVHSLIHLADDAEKYGSLDNISAFKYENYMQSLKKMVRAHSNELSQVIRRVVEMENVQSKLVVCQSLKIGMNKLKHFTKQGNDCFLLKNGYVIRITNIVDKNIHYKLFKDKLCISWYCVPSSKLGIFKVGKLSHVEYICNQNDILCKQLLLPYNTDFLTEEFLCLPYCSSEM